MDVKRRRGEKSAAGYGYIDLEALDCPCCYHALGPPVFQCAVGHVICSSCHDKLLNKDKCHVCAITGGYNRCITFEHILQSVKTPCSNSIYGCTVKTHYHKREEHENSCLHAPCFCPQGGCGFAGSVTELHHHLTTDHMLPTTEFTAECPFTIQMKEGMHMLQYKEEGGPLFLVKFTLVPHFGNIVSILCLDPHAVMRKHRFECHVDFYCAITGTEHHSVFQILNTNLSNGFPTEEGSYSFFLPTISSDQHTSINKNLSINLLEVFEP